ncbi:MAG: hypothetical protein K1X78_24360 [Verrucomicrobiaceae bacterium]|nr:hypothetical protein [Verrucomicrobiaceae bacterium]
MKSRRIRAFALAITGVFSCVSAQNPGTKVLCFEKDAKDSEHHVFLMITAHDVRGTQSSGDENATASGRLWGIVREDGVLHLTYHYTIEDQPGSEEQLMKAEKGRLLIGEGELDEHGPGQLVLKSPKDVKFTKVLKQVPLTFPAFDSAEGKAVVKAVDEAVKELTGISPAYDGGEIRMAGSWAVYQGFLKLAPDQKKPADPAMAANVEQREFQAELKKDAKGRWKVLSSAFANDAGLFDQFPSEEGPIPWQLRENANGR